LGEQMPAYIQELIAASERNEAVLNSSYEEFTTGKITVEECRVILTDTLNSYRIMKTQLKNNISGLRGETKKTAKDTLKSFKEIIKTQIKLISLIDNGEVFEE